MNKAALYLRSSKDRSDVSIDAQKRELTELAKRKNILIVDEYADVVESAKDEDRPDFQRLLYDLKSGRRTWDTLLVTDTSRLSRRQYMAHVFDHECKKRGISLIFSKLPESDPVTDMVLKGVMRVFDELHSEMSRQKGLAGMAENIRQGFRAGGKAPRGYQLKKIETGAIRDGEPVTKTRLEFSSEAPKIKKYFRARLNGASRSAANTDNLPTSSLVELEWNAFTYAGCSVWNMRYPKSENRKRRPRNEWVIEENTHEALINMQEADQLVSKLEQSKRNRRVSKYLLSGMIETPTGKAWHGCSTRGKSNYRTDGKYVAAETLEKAITQKIKSDALSDEFIKELTAACHKQYSSPPTQHQTSSTTNRSHRRKNIKNA